MSSVILFRRLAVLTAAFAYLQIALGGLVRVSGSGKGCPDWPLCNGHPYPAFNTQSFIEFSHRTVGGITSISLVALFIAGWLVYRGRRSIVPWLVTAALGMIAIEVVVGGLVVDSDLQPWLVLVHLGIAMGILGFIAAAAVFSQPASEGVPDAGYRRLAAIGAGLTYLLLLTGSTVVASSADSQCRSWPLCGSGLAFDFSGANAFTMLHRISVLVVGLLILHVASTAYRKWKWVPGLRLVALLTIVVFVLQVAVGAGSAVSGAAGFDGVHVALATLVWLGMVTIAMLSLPRTESAPAPAMAAMQGRSA